MGPTLAYNGQSSIEHCKFLSVVCVGIIEWLDTEAKDLWDCPLAGSVLSVAITLPRS